MYKLQQNGVKRLSDGAYIPNASGNMDWNEYLIWLDNGGVVLPEFTEEELLANAKTAKANSIKQTYESSVRAMVGSTDTTEMASWTKQEAEARAWVADNKSITPIIDNLLIGRNMGETKAELVAKIITKADAYAVSYAQVLGMYHAKQKALEACTTVEEVLAI